MKKHTRKLRDRNLPFLLGLLLLAVVGNAQTLQPVSAWGYKWNRGVFVHGLGIPADTATLTTEQRAFPHLGIKGETLYRWSPAQNKWIAPGGSSFDTTSLSNRIDQRVKYSDTAAMLTNYRHWLAGYLTSADISGKLNISDTASMLANYRHWLAGYLKAADIAGKLNISDTAAMLLTYRHWAAGYLKNITGLVTAGTNVTVTGSGTAGSPYVINATASGTTVDTTSLSNRINQKLNIADTAGKWVGYIFKSNDSVYYDIGGTRYFAYIDEGSSPCQTGSVGGQVVWNSGLNFDISAAPFYSINCQRYTSEGGSVTLSAADATYGRFDIIAFDTSGNVVVIPGDPAENPVVPSYDPTLYWYRTTVFIPAGATEPQGISDELIYDENVEWATATGGTITANFNSTTFAVQGSKSALVSARSNGSYLQYTSTDTLNVNNYQNVSFWLRLVGSMTNQQNVSVQFLLGNTAISNAVVATVAKNNTTGWQLIALNMGQFSFTAFSFNRVRIIFSGSSSSSLYIDVVKLQTGISSGGGGGTVTDAYQKMTDGTNTATATGNGIFKIRSANNVISVVVANDDPTHGDNVLLTFNRNNIDSLQFAQITGLVDSLNRLGDKLEGWRARNDTFEIKYNGVWYFAYDNTAHYKANQFTTGQGLSETNAISLRRDSSTVTPYNVLWMALDSSLHIGPYPTGGTGTVTSFTFTDANGFTGTVTNSTTTPTLSIDQQVASALQSGKLSAADWTTFNSKLSNITGLVTAGTNVTITGSGTSGSPYVVNSSGGGASGWSFGGNSTTSGILSMAGTTNTASYRLISGGREFLRADSAISGDSRFYTHLYGSFRNYHSQTNSAFTEVAVDTTNHRFFRMLRPGVIDFNIYIGRTAATSGGNNAVVFSNTPTAAATGNVATGTAVALGTLYADAAYASELGTPGASGASTNSILIKNGASSNAEMVFRFFDGGGGWGNLSLQGHSSKAGHSVVDYDFRLGASTLDNGTLLWRAYGTNKNIAIGTAPTDVASRLFSVQTTTKTSQPYPAMTQTQRDAISSPAAWSGVVCTDCTATDGSTGVLQIWNGSAWKNAW